MTTSWLHLDYILTTSWLHVLRSTTIFFTKRCCLSQWTAGSQWSGRSTKPSRMTRTEDPEPLGAPEDEWRIRVVLFQKKNIRKFGNMIFFFQCSFFSKRLFVGLCASVWCIFLYLERSRAQISVSDPDFLSETEWNITKSKSNRH